jgi:hypothetical protein
VENNLRSSNLYVSCFSTNNGGSSNLYTIGSNNLYTIKSPKIPLTTVLNGVIIQLINQIKEENE